jgi:hypothetical protein
MRHGRRSLARKTLTGWRLRCQKANQYEYKINGSASHLPAYLLPPPTYNVRALCNDD